jgi:glycosyltransferase involved in cell wall biosynthesis
MKILYVVPALQHPTMPGALRHYHLLRLLARRHAVTLLALSRAEVTREAQTEIGGWVDRLHVFPVEDCFDAAGGHGMRRRLARERAVHRAVRRMRGAFLELAHGGEFDAVLFHGKDVYPVIEGFRGLPVVVDFCDATSMRQRQRLRHSGPLQAALAGWRWARARRTERRLLEHTPHLAFISARDRDAVLGPGGDAAVVPNGIDLGYWTRRAAPAGAVRVVFTGVMSYAPNEDAALWLMREILPRLRRAHPALELQVVGRSPSAAVVEEAARSPGATVTGFVEDVRPYLEGATVFVAPLRFASGLQNKVLEALAMDVPVVTTPVVAEGLRVEGAGTPPVHVAEGEEGIAASVRALLADGSARARLAREGRRYVEAHFDWERSADQLEALCLAAAGVQAVPPALAGATA